MRAGVSTACLFPKLVEESLYDLAVNGIPCVEVFLNTHSELKKSFAHEISSILKRFDVKCVSVHPFTCEMETLMFFSEYERRMDDILEYYRYYFEFMNIVGAEIFVFHGGKGNKPLEFYCERYSKLYRLGKEYGIKVALENVLRCQSATSAFIRQAANALGNEFAFVLDTKQALRAGETPFMFLEAAGKKVEHIHISDSGELGDCLPIGKGSFHFKKFLDRLNVINPDANIMLELYRSGFGGINELVTSYNILDNMIGNIKCNGGDSR